MIDNIDAVERILIDASPRMRSCCRWYLPTRWRRAWEAARWAIKRPARRRAAPFRLVDAPRRRFMLPGSTACGGSRAGSCAETFHLGVLACSRRAAGHLRGWPARIFDAARSAAPSSSAVIGYRHASSPAAIAGLMLLFLRPYRRQQQSIIRNLHHRRHMARGAAPSRLMPA